MGKKKKENYKVERLHKIMKANAHRLDELTEDLEFMNLFDEIISEGLLENFEKRFDGFATIDQVLEGDGVTPIHQNNSNLKNNFIAGRKDYGRID